MFSAKIVTSEELYQRSSPPTKRGCRPSRWRSTRRWLGGQANLWNVSDDTLDCCAVAGAESIEVVAGFPCERGLVVEVATAA